MEEKNHAASRRVFDCDVFFVRIGHNSHIALSPVPRSSWPLYLIRRGERVLRNALLTESCQTSFVRRIGYDAMKCRKRQLHSTSHE